MGGKTHVAKERRRARAAERKAKKEAAKVEKAADEAAIKDVPQKANAVPAPPNGNKLPNGDSKPKAAAEADASSSSEPSTKGTSVTSNSPSQQSTTPPTSVAGSEPSKNGPPDVVAPQSAAARTAARQRRGERRADLPPPLHGNVGGPSRHHEHVEPASELEWEFVEGDKLPEEEWGVLTRAKGPVEREEEAEADDSATGE